MVLPIFGSGFQEDIDFLLRSVETQFHGVKMKVQKIANLEQRQQTWRNEVERWWKVEARLILCISLLWGFSFYWSIISVFNSEFDWLSCAITLGFILVFSLLPLMQTYPRMPTQADVDNDIAIIHAWQNTVRK